MWLSHRAARQYLGQSQPWFCGSSLFLYITSLLTSSCIVVLLYLLMNSSSCKVVEMRPLRQRGKMAVENSLVAKTKNRCPPRPCILSVTLEDSMTGRQYRRPIKQEIHQTGLCRDYHPILFLSMKKSAFSRYHCSSERFSISELVLMRYGYNTSIFTPLSLLLLYSCLVILGAARKNQTSTVEVAAIFPSARFTVFGPRDIVVT